MKKGRHAAAFSESDASKAVRGHYSRDDAGKDAHARCFSSSTGAGHFPVRLAIHMPAVDDTTLPTLVAVAVFVVPRDGPVLIAVPARQPKIVWGECRWRGDHGNGDGGEDELKPNAILNYYNENSILPNTLESASELASRPEPVF